MWLAQQSRSDVKWLKVRESEAEEMVLILVSPLSAEALETQRWHQRAGEDP